MKITSKKHQLKYLITKLLFIAAVTSSNGQDWQKNYPNTGQGGYTQIALDGGYITVGRPMILLMKTDLDGTQQWLKEYDLGSIYTDLAHSLSITRDGGYIITGTTSSQSGGLFLMKTDLNGNKEWEQVYGDNGWGWDVKQTNDDGYIITGNKDASNLYVVKTDMSGNIIWSNTYGDVVNIFQNGHEVEQTSDGGYIVAGNFEKNGIRHQLLKIDSNGAEETSYSIPNTFSSTVQQISNGKYVAGIDSFLVKLEINLNEEWKKPLLPTFNNVRITHIRQTQDGGYIATGSLKSLNGDMDIFLVKTNDQGIEEWHQIFGGPDDDVSESVEETQDGAFIIGGSSKSFNGGIREFFLIKTNQITVNIEKAHQQSYSLKIAPNPFIDHTTIKLEGINKIMKEIKLYIYDIQGRIVKSELINDKNEIKLYREDLESGTFSLKIIHKNQLIGTGKLIVH